MKDTFTIKELRAENRPMEKLMTYGVMTLSNQELLAIILGSGTRGKNAISLSEYILNTLGARELLFKSFEDLLAIDGIGPAKACRMLASLEFGRRLSGINNFEKISLNSPDSVANYLYDYYRHIDREEFIVILLDTKNKIIRVETVSTGTLNKSIVHPRDVFRRAISYNANSVILAHNHPSGDPEPSREDLDITSRLIDVGKLIGINVLDHIVVGLNRYVSIREKNLIRGFI